MLTEYFNDAIAPLGILTPSPVLSVWLSQEGTFCFVEMRSVQDCNACMQLLQGISLGGRTLRVGRPADYKPPPPALENYIVGYAPGQFAPPPVPSALGLGSIPGIEALGATALPASSDAPATIVPHSSPMPTKVLLLLHMVTLDELNNEEEFTDIVLDIREECEKFGKVEQVVIPRPLKPGEPENTDAEDGKDAGPRVEAGHGRIFVLFDDPLTTAKAKTALNGRMFSDNKVEALYYHTDFFKAMVYV
jgi:splicing factor U2AF subunit